MGGRLKASGWLWAGTGRAKASPVWSRVRAFVARPGAKRSASQPIVAQSSPPSEGVQGKTLLYYVTSLYLLPQIRH